MSSHLSPDVDLLPTSRQLWKATGIAAAIATGVLLTVVLPAEYGIDPTRIGRVLGLTAMGTSKPASGEVASAAKPEAERVPVSPVVKSDAPFRSDTITLTLAPGKGSEIKATMAEGQCFVFSWVAEGGEVNFDMHGEPPKAGNKFTSYWKDKGQTSGHGAFVAPFAGTHGWYWGNRGSSPVTITVTTSGFYSKLGKM